VIIGPLTWDEAIIEQQRDQLKDLARSRNEWVDIAWEAQERAALAERDRDALRAETARLREAAADLDTRLPAMPLDTRTVPLRYRVVGDGTPTLDSSDTPADLPPANADAAITAVLRRDALTPPFAGTA